MKSAFADSFYFFALLNERDAAQAKAIELSTTFQGRMVTTGWILTELGNGLAKPHQRSLFVSICNDLRTQPNILLVPCSDELLAAGIDLYAQRPDKEWSLTDCISFVVMQREGITEALTGESPFRTGRFCRFTEVSSAKKNGPARGSGSASARPSSSPRSSTCPTTGSGGSRG